MTSFEFLAPSGAAVARSPMERQALAAGARFEARDGWNLAVAYADEDVDRTVGWTDTSHLRKLEVHGRHELTPGLASRANGAWWCPVTRDRTLVIGSSDAAAADAVEVTTALAALTIVGPMAREVFARFCALDLRPGSMPVGGFRPGSVARTPGYVSAGRWASTCGRSLPTRPRASAAGRWGSTRSTGRSPVREIFRPGRMWRRRPQLKDRYDVVIIGGGSHGLATAYYLRQRGITDVCILEKGYIGSGAAGRNTTILRSNYKTPEGARFYDASIKLYEGLAKDLNFNLLFSQCGHLTLAHSDRALFVMANRAEVNRLEGIDSRLIGPHEVKRLAPAMVVSDDATYPIMGALYHPPGGIIRHDAVVWGFARGVDGGGAEIHPYTEVLGLERSNGRVDAVRTNRGTIRAGQVISATAGWSTLTCDMAGVPLPITTHILQAFVTEPLKPLLDVVIVSSQMHVYISQTDRGEFLVGAEIEPWTTYRMQGTLNFLQECSRHSLELFPQLERARMLRSWAGLCDLSPDYSPILGRTEVDNFHVSAGWGTYGFKAAPIVGKTLAELVDTGRTPDLIAPFALERFYEDRLVSELAAAAVSH